MNNQRKRAAIVSGLEMSGYGILRSLGPLKVPILGLTDGERDFGRYSKYCREYFRLHANGDEEHTCRLLIDWAARFPEKPVLFANSDWFALLLAKHREELSRCYEFHWVPAETISCVTHKARISQFSEQHGMPVPRLHYTQPEEDLAQVARDFPFPCLVKVTRHFERASLPEVDLRVVHSAADLLAVYDQHPKLLGKTFWQQIIEGEDNNVFECNVLIKKSGEVGGVCCVRRLRQYPPRFGMMTYGRSEENETVIAETLKLLRLLDYRGLANVEFRYQPKDNRYYFLEMNPRLPWSTMLFTAAGVNLAYRAYLDLAGDEEDSVFDGKQRNGIYVLTLDYDLGWYSRTRGSRQGGLGQWIASLLKARSYAWWDWRDPMPGVWAGVHLLRISLGKLLNRFNRTSRE